MLHINHCHSLCNTLPYVSVCACWLVNCAPVGEKVVSGSVNMSVIAPMELRVDGVCCVGLSSHGTLLLHNPTTHWMRVQLAVTQINIDGQPADHNNSPFILRPKVTIDPNSTESVKVWTFCSS